MMSAVRCSARALALGLALLLPVGVLAQDEGAAVVAPPPVLDRGCPARPELFPFTAMSQVGMERSGWLVHQAIIPESKDTYFTAGERDTWGIKAVPPEEVRRLGAPDPAVPLWVFGKADAKACRATPTTWWAVRMGTNADRQTYLMAEVQVDCELLAPGKLSGTPVALRQKDEPTGCKLRRPTAREVGRSGEGLPSDMVEHVPVHECSEPGCARLWETFAIRWEDGTSLHDLTVTWMERNGKRDSCDWDTEDFSLLLLRPAGKLDLVPLKGGGALLGVLYDSRGARTVLSRQLSVLIAHDVTRPKAAPKSVRYGSPTDEDLRHAKRSLSPCKH